MRRTDLEGAKRRAKRVLAGVGVGLTLAAATLPAHAWAQGNPGGGGDNGHKVGHSDGNGHKVG
jgi:hypothetical protein